MTTRTRNGNISLTAAMSLLIQTQAQFASDLAETRREFVEFWKEFAEIRRELDAIKAVLLRHEAVLERLPDAIREKIGFKN